VTLAVGPDAVTNLIAKPLTGTTASLSWTAPAAGPTAPGPTVTSYGIVVSKLSAATTSDPGVSVSQASATASTATVTGLTAGTKYWVTVTANHDALAGTPAKTTMVTPYNTKLTLSATPAKPVGGESVGFDGQLTRKVGGSSEPLAGKSVGVFAKFAGAAKYVLVGSVMTTKADGTYAESYVPTKGGVYVALFYPGDPPSGDNPGTSYAVSDVLNVVPQPIVSLTATGKAHGTKFTMHVKGKVSPNEQGKKVTVYRTVRGTPTKFGKARLDAHGRYTFVKKHLGAGTYKLQAKIKSHFGLAAATSPKFSIRAS
jgi:fibronectin type III domain protein